MTRNWKRIYPNNLLHALRLSKDYAREKHNRSVERIADLMGVTPDSLYKWLANGRLPANLVLPYEMACGCDFVSRWFMGSTGKLVIDVPTGKAANASDIQILQEALADASGALIRFYNGKADAVDVLGAVQSAMEGLAWHKVNVTKAGQPELDFGEGE